MKNLYAYFIKTFFGVDLKCDICGRVCKTERGKNVHRVVHFKKILFVNKHQKRILGKIRGIKFVLDKNVPKNKVKVGYEHDPRTH